MSNFLFGFCSFTCLNTCTSVQCSVFKCILYSSNTVLEIFEYFHETEYIFPLTKCFLHCSVSFYLNLPTYDYYIPVTHQITMFAGRYTAKLNNTMRKWKEPVENLKRIKPVADPALNEFVLFCFVLDQFATDVFTYIYWVLPHNIYSRAWFEMRAYIKFSIH